MRLWSVVFGLSRCDHDASRHFVPVGGRETTDSVCPQCHRALTIRTPPMTQRRQVKFLKVQAVDPPLGVHRIVLSPFDGQSDPSDWKSSLNQYTPLCRSNRCSNSAIELATIVCECRSPTVSWKTSMIHECESDEAANANQFESP